VIIAGFERKFEGLFDQDSIWSLQMTSAPFPFRLDAPSTDKIQMDLIEPCVVFRVVSSAMKSTSTCALIGPLGVEKYDSQVQEEG